MTITRFLTIRALFTLLVLIAVAPVFAQTATFTYQGRLTDGGTPANGVYDLDFALFDSASGGGQVGSTQTVTSVSVSSGVFTVSLDFGANAFPGANRFLEISARLAGGGSFTLLTPRQQITSTPYAVRSLVASTADGLSIACTGCVQDANISAVDGSKVSGAIPVASVPAGSASYIQNTNSTQSGSNFNISGNGTTGGTLSGNLVNATTQYNIAGLRVVSVPGLANTFIGTHTGDANSSGGSNSFFGDKAGSANTSGNLNTFVGSDAGRLNTTGTGNSFFGFGAGDSSTGSDNTFAGSAAGRLNTGSSNSFFGRLAGESNTASNNAFFGDGSGRENSSGTHNSFFGSITGASNTVGNDNSFFGWGAGANSRASNNAFFGASSGLLNQSGSSNSFFGASSGLKNTLGSSNSFFGSSAGKANTTGSRNAFFGSDAGTSNTSGFGNSFFGNNAGLKVDSGSRNSFFGDSAGEETTTGSSNAFFGDGAGEDNTTGSGNIFVGAIAGERNTEGSENCFVGIFAGGQNTTGEFNSALGYLAGSFNLTGSNNTLIGAGADVGPGNLTYATAIGSGAKVNASNTIVLGRQDGSDFVVVPGLLTIPNLAVAGSTQLCRNSFDKIGACSSSLRYKTNLTPYRSGLSVINRLRPISFTWKDGGMRDLGLGAEEVEQIDPLLVTYNKEGLVEGVKYDRINVVLVNAVREQQNEIERQRAEALKQQTQIKTLQTANAALNGRLAFVERALLKISSGRRAGRRTTK